MFVCACAFMYMYVSTGSSFVGSGSALKPPAPDAANNVLPVMGLTCDGTGFIQVIGPCHIQMSHVTYGRVIAHMNESCHTYACVVSHTNLMGLTSDFSCR